MMLGGVAEGGEQSQIRFESHRYRPVPNLRVLIKSAGANSDTGFLSPLRLDFFTVGPIVICV